MEEDKPLEVELLPPSGGSNVIPAPSRFTHDEYGFDPLFAHFRIKITLQNGMTIEAEGIPTKASITRENGRPHVELEMFAPNATLTSPVRKAPDYQSWDRSRLRP